MMNGKGLDDERKERFVEKWAFSRACYDYFLARPPISTFLTRKCAII